MIFYSKVPDWVIYLSEFKLVYTSLISMSPLHSDEKGHSPPSENSHVYVRVEGP